MIVPPDYWAKLKAEFVRETGRDGFDLGREWEEWLVEKLYLHSASPPLPMDSATLKIGTNREHKIISLRIGPSLVILRPTDVPKIVDDLVKAANMADGNV